MKRIKVTLAIVLCLFSASQSARLFAQSNRLIDEMLLEEKASFGKSVFLVLSAAGLVAETASVTEALSFLEGTGWHSRLKEADDPIKLGEYSFIIMKSFRISGGLFYSLFPGPRYAARELKYLRFYTGRYDAGRVLSGDDVLGILGKALTWQEAD